MSNIKYTRLKIYLRQTSHNRTNNYDRPDWFSHEKSFKNLLDTMDWNISSLVVCFDGELNDHWTEKYMSKYPFEIRLIDTKPHITKDRDASNCSQSLVVQEMYKDKEELGENTICGLFENDYVYLPNWQKATLDLYNMYGGGFYTSLYCHPDTWMFTVPNRTDHWGIYCDLKSSVFVSNYGYWRDLPSITSNYLMDSKVFFDDYDLFSQGLADNTTCGLLRERNRPIIASIGGLACHPQKPFVTPFIDWKALMDKTELL